MVCGRNPPSPLVTRLHHLPLGATAPLDVHLYAPLLPLPPGSRRHRPSHHPPLTHPHLLSRHYARVTPLSLCVRHSELHVAKSVSSVVSIIISFP